MNGWRHFLTAEPREEAGRHPSRCRCPCKNVLVCSIARNYEMRQFWLVLLIICNKSIVSEWKNVRGLEGRGECE